MSEFLNMPDELDRETFISDVILECYSSDLKSILGEFDPRKLEVCILVNGGSITSETCNEYMRVLVSRIEQSLVNLNKDLVDTETFNEIVDKRVNMLLESKLQRIYEVVCE